jgi:CDP-6-deoxy-D-xylo-4-hexulose-3-dehydrase
MIKLCADIINRNDIDCLISWLQGMPKFTKGEKTLEFEEKFSSIIGCDHSVFCNSGSSANLLIVSALIQGGYLRNKKIIVPQVSWSTTVFPAMQLGLTPIMCDCNLMNLGINIDDFEKIVRKEKPAALIMVHVVGFNSHIERVLEICNEHDVLLIEDTCESLGSVVNNKHLGSFGFASSFSFYFGHHISTIEGGMVCTNNKEFANILRMIRSHGWDRDIDEESKREYRQMYNVGEFDALYKFYYAGFNLRSTDLQAFIGLNQLPKLDYIAQKRHENFATYKNSLGNNLWKPTLKQDLVSNMGYPLLLSNRNEISQRLKEDGIECRPLVSGSMGIQPAWKDAYGESVMQYASIVNSQGMYVPNHSELSESEIQKICGIINKFGEPHV